MKARSHETGLFDAAGPSFQGNARGVAAEGAALARVALESGADRLFDYAVPAALAGQVEPGRRVRVPVGPGNRLQTAFCVELPADSPVERVKYIAEVLDPAPLLDGPMLRLARWIAQYYCCPLGQVLTAMVPAAVKQQAGLRRVAYVRLADRPRCDGPAALPDRLSAQGRAVLEFLRTRRSDADQGLPLDEVLAAVRCTRAPITTLARTGWVVITRRPCLDTPADPPDLALASLAPPTFELNTDQKSVLETAGRLIAQGGFHVILLHGVTGSGKTEVYLRCIEQVVAAGRGALVLVPEIALTPQTVARFRSRFGQVALLHSHLTAVQRHQQWRWIATGEAPVVVGARSAVFAPLPRLGLIVVDEEHEPGYKQDASPRYHARDVALKRAADLRIPVILGSATPSLESLHNGHTRPHYLLLRLPKRVLDLPLPPVHVVDMRDELRQRRGVHLFSRLLELELKHCLQAGRQAILLLNRRGHSSYVFCPGCDFVLACPYCDVSLTCHKAPGALDGAPRTWVLCHYCSHSSQLPRACPVCGRALQLIGPGTQQAEEELARKLPQVRFRRVDSDSMRADSYARVLGDFGRGEISVLLGTQMIGKGLDFPNVALVGVLNADTALAITDFRSSERTFQLIAQVAGRCGRARADSRVIVQTFLPQDPAIKLACTHDYEAFARRELESRRRAACPPWQRWARILLRDRRLAQAQAAAQRLRQAIDEMQAAKPLHVVVVGPTPAPIARLESCFRFQLLLKAPAAEPIQELLAELRAKHLPHLPAQAVVDVDPLNLM